MTFPIADTTKHSKQNIDLWLIDSQKSINITRTVYETTSGAYIKYQGYILYVRGRKGGTWHSNY